MIYDKIHGCLLAGALGDALGAPIEFKAWKHIQEKYGPYGVSELVAGIYPRGAVTDDTQMTLFTAEGLINAFRTKRAPTFDKIDRCVHAAYKRWLSTQSHGLFKKAKRPTKGLLSVEALHASRAPGATCLTALQEMTEAGICQPMVNDSKGTGAIMRVAPVGLIGPRIGDAEDVFLVGARTGWLTHQHPSGYLAAGFLALVIDRLVRGAGRELAISMAVEELVKYDGYGEVLKMVNLARKWAKVSNHGVSSANQAALIGQGWIAEEALGIGLYCLLVAENVWDGLLIAVNHSGDSDTTGSIAGHLLGAYHGAKSIPAKRHRHLELKELIDMTAHELMELRTAV